LVKPGTAWLWIVGGIVALVALALIVGSGMLPSTVPNPETPTPSVTAMVTSQPSPTSTVATPTATVTRPTMTPTIAPSATSTPATPTWTPTPIVAIETPRLISPAGGSVANGSRLELRWASNLPNSNYGYRVNLRHESGAPSYTSPVLDVEQWSLALPASAVGEWRWFVEVIRRTGTPQVAARSSESIFYHDPFASPLPTPAR
jgi:hypothetical protein